MKSASLIAVAALLLATTQSAHAVKLTNRDSVDHKVTIVEGENETSKTIGSGEEVSLCDSGCVIRIESGEEFELTGTEIVSYEDNYLYDDSPVTEEGDSNMNTEEPPVDNQQ